jgi:hypothetical protein
MVALVTVEVTLVGADGRSTDDTGAAAEAGETPVELDATTLKTYETPTVRPVITQVVGTTPRVAVTLQPKEPGTEVTT